MWRSRRPCPERLADALGEVMVDVLRSRGHLWIAGRLDAVVTCARPAAPWSARHGPPGTPAV
ncbi:GTP-binding protein [Streptomyces sp. RerS4]|uniref:GTP-binding protein n=1 Tax=Streptomyces sp. RerS4 TaxID=2942449 RepID=UPI00201BF4F0|nr:GTP-binding protein [Streptomyces sp. RerS4]UQX04546.1 GTP-binding protein [Streptomyces sp. RerS4]